VSNFDNYLLVGDTDGKVDVSGGELTFLNSWMSIGRYGTGELNVSGSGTFRGNRMSVGQKSGSSGSLTVTGGLIDIDDYVYLGVSSTATADVSGGELHADNLIALGAFDSQGNGTINISGNGVVSSGGGMMIGRKGSGEINVNGGQLNANRMTLGRYSGGIGELNLSTGTVSVVEYATIGNENDGAMNISGGTFNADRMTIAQEAGSTGHLTVSGGSFSLADKLDISRYGSATVTIQGSGATFQCDRMDLDENGVLEVILDGSNGIGSGIEVSGDVALMSGAELDLSFLGTVADGTYTLITSGGIIDDQTGGNLLSSASVAEGWTYDIVTTEGMTELQATIPEPATISLLIAGGVAGLIRRRK
jgi:T5SS/PEP-CTERM-associated repeat protein